MSHRSHQIQYGTVTIQYDLTFAPRKTLAISVHPDLHVTVCAPTDAALDDVAATVRRRAPWILRRQREFTYHQPHIPPRQYRSGETHRYLGRQYRLQVNEAEREQVKLTRGYLQVATANPADTAQVQQLLNTWYRKQAQRILPEQLNTLLPRFQQHSLAEPHLVIKPLTARWGSCTQAGTITLNLKLMQVPKPYIDYVIVHELCHLVEYNHSPRFYALLDYIMPDWRTRRQGLNHCEVT